MCRGPLGPRFTIGYPITPPNHPTFLQSLLSSRASQSLPGEILSVFLSHPPYQVCGLSDVLSVLGVCMLYKDCTGDLIRKWAPSISTGRGKGTQTKLWSGNRAVLQTSKNTALCNLLSLQQPFKSPAKASGFCLGPETGSVCVAPLQSQNTLYRWNQNELFLHI